MVAISVKLILFLAALIVFGIAAFVQQVGPVNLLAVGAALVTAGLLFG